MFTLTNAVGRLVEVLMVSPVSTEEIDAADLRMAEFAQSATGGVIICADYRQTRVLSDEHASKMVSMYQRHNIHVAFSAILIAPESAVSLLQMERVIREANLPQRRCFRDVRAALEWLSPHLTVVEKGRAAGFWGAP